MLKDREDVHNPSSGVESLYGASASLPVSSVMRTPSAALGYDRRPDSGSGFGLLSSSGYGYGSLSVCF